MQSQKQRAIPGSQFRHTAPADFRVVARYADRSTALLSMADTRWQAIHLARQFVFAVAHDARTVDRPGKRNRKRMHRGNRASFRRARENRIRAVFVEKWVGGTIDGHWRRFDSEDGGFDHVFDTKKKKERDASSLRSGDEVECVLLAEKTRKGGWMARLHKRTLAGPITNTAEVPQSASAGKVVKLRIGAISAKHERIQFHWPMSSNGQTPARKQG